MTPKIIFATYPMAFETPGGGEVQLISYFQSLSRIGVDVKLLDMWKPNFKQANILHFFSCVGGSEHLCRYAKNLGLKLVVSSSLWITEETKCDYPYEDISRQLHLTDLIITNSTAESKQLATVFGLGAEKLVVVPNAISRSFKACGAPAVSFSHHFGLNKPFVLNVANIEPRKNQLNLAKAMHDFPDHDLVIVGHIRDENYSKAVFDAGGKSVRYLGYIENNPDLLRSAYQECSLFCLPSFLETPGLAALEAAASGATLVITERGATREYFGNSATYVTPESVENIKAGIRLTLTRKMIANSESIFTWDDVAGTLVNAYKRVLCD